MARLTFKITGMSCVGCARRVEAAIRAVPKVDRVSVSLTGETAQVDFADQAGDVQAGARDVVAAVREAGYTALSEEPVGEAIPTEPETETLAAVLAGHWQVFFSCLIAAVFLLDMVAMWVKDAPFLDPWWAFALALPVQILVGAGFYRGAYYALKSGVGSMDQLVVLGTSAAFAYSLYALLRLGPEAAHHIYFESAVFIITFVKIGKFLETRINRYTRRALSGLVRLQPSTAWVVVDGVAEEQPIASVVPGMRVMVRPGARIPVDGRIVSGETDVDESMLTGESAAIPCGPGDRVIAGTLNGMAAIEVDVLAVGERTRLSEMMQMIAEAEHRTGGYSRLIDRISAVFVPLVVALALLTFVGWWIYGATLEQALLPAIATLVIACPCALGLAIPTALVGAVGAAARHGLLIRDFTVFERYRPINRIVFDKTGTLTYGKPRVVRTISLAAIPESTWLPLAAALESASNHPLGRAVINYAEQKGYKILLPKNVKVIPGQGLTGDVAGKALRIAAAPPALSADLGGDDAYTDICVWIDGEPAGYLSLRDALREDAPQLVAALAADNISCTILSGDKTPATARIAAAAGIHDFKGEQSPEDKALAIQSYQEAGGRVAMVADGVNDAPGLVTADLGIAMGDGSDIAADHADIALIRADISRVWIGLQLLDAARRKIRQNLVWAVVFNGIGVPLAMAGLLTPMFAGLAMALSSLTVVTNATLLSRWRPHNVLSTAQNQNPVASQQSVDLGQHHQVADAPR